AYELTADWDGHGSVAAWRRGRRWVQDWAPVSTDGSAEPVWRTDGVYLTTGGTRGLGLALARHLVRSGVRKLALVSRTGHCEAVAELESSGADVLLLAADAGEPDQLRAALGAARDHFGALHGVIHAAGRPASGMIQRSTIAEAQAVLAPKI